MRKKAEELLKVPGAKRVPPHEYLPDMVCVIVCGNYEAAAYMYSEGEYNHFMNDASNRNKDWLTIPGAASLCD